MSLVDCPHRVALTQNLLGCGFEAQISEKDLAGVLSPHHMTFSPGVSADIPV